MDALREELGLPEEGIEDEYLASASRLTDRKTTLKKFSTFFKNSELAEEVERGIFKFSLLYPLTKGKPKSLQETIYEDKATFLLKELDSSQPPFNKTLLSRLQKGEIEPVGLAFLSPQELDPKHWEKPLKKKEYRAFKAKNMATTNKYTCKKCKGNRHSISQKQMSSADEPMTTFIVCLDCGLTIKFRA